MGLQHAREWIAGTTVNYLVYHFLTQEPQILQEYQFIVVPIVNPDGYNYSWTSDRLWRKNRNPNTGGAGVGVDLNRNYNTHWGEGGSSSDSTSDIFMGTSPASELEVQAVSKYFLEWPNIVAAFDFHSFSQLIMRPYGWTPQDSDLEPFLSAAGSAMAAAIQGVRGTVYESMKSYDLYVTTGSAGDWFYDDTVKSKFGRRVFSFDVELYPSQTGNGFVVPVEEIEPCGQEIAAGMKAFIEYISKNNPSTSSLVTSSAGRWGDRAGISQTLWGLLPVLAVFCLYFG